MGKHKKQNKNKQISSSASQLQREIDYPFVSVCTPTFNRRPFIPMLIECYQRQDYPMDRMEWIIIDDGTDKIADLVSHLPFVKYFQIETKTTLGRKRNMMHEKSKGDIIVYMDDDDYYPPCRVSHAVEMLQKNPKALCAGSSEIYIYFKHLDKIYQFGPYGPRHATAGTFALRRELLKQTSYNETASLAEEKEFLKDYTIPFVQLDPLKTILVFSHIHNTFDKKKLLVNANELFVKPSNKEVRMFVKDERIRDFYMNQIETLLQSYEPGDPSMKPDVIEQTKELEIKRQKMIEEQMRLHQQQQLQNPNLNQTPTQNQQLIQDQMQQPHSNVVLVQDGKQTILTPEQIVNIIKQQQQQIETLVQQIHLRDQKINELERKLNE
jgi:hypothetical protein